MAESQEEKFRRMTEAPVGGLIAKLAVPCIISMLVTSFYNMADTFFVGQLKSNAATGAVGVVFSMMAIIQAVGFFSATAAETLFPASLEKRIPPKRKKWPQRASFPHLRPAPLL